MSNIQTIQLHQLQLSTLNARKTGGENVADLIASIAADGLLQNLTVIEDAQQGCFTNTYQVVAGGRRLRALQALAQEDRLPDSLRDGVPCRVVDADVALDASTAENTIREQMHPVDEIEAYVGMAGKGKTDLEIALRFGQDPRHVAGMRKLGAVSPLLLKALRDDELSFDQLKAFTTTDDHHLQERVFGELYENIEPSAIRRLLNQTALSVKSKLARFVTVDAYESAGGTVRRDLFGDDAWLEDRGLAERLALEKLDKRAAKERKKGWGWVEVSLDDPVHNKLRRVYDQTEEQMPWLGVFVTIAHDGTGTRLEGPYERPGDRQRVALGESVPASAEEAKATKAPPKDELSMAQVSRLKGTRTEIASRKLIGAERFMVTALAASLAADLIGDRRIGDGPVKVRHNRTNNNADFREGREMQQQIDDFGTGIDALRWSDLLGGMKTASQVQEWLLQQPDSTTTQLLAFCAAQMIELDDSTPDDVSFLTRAGLDLADHWQPTGDWLATLPKAAMLRIVREVRGAEASTALESLKKDALVPEAAKLLANTGYLPEPLRGANYLLRTEQRKVEDRAKPTLRKPAAGKKSATKAAATKKTAAKKTVKAVTKKPAKKATKKPASKAQKAKAGAK